eukprot:6203982-Pleurochrysis_carterae.AAC.1
MPDGAPAHIRPAHAPASKELPQLVASAVAAKAYSPPPPDLLRTYQSLVGALLYCSMQTRPDVVYAVDMLCRAMSCPTPALLEAAHRVLAYLNSPACRPPLRTVRSWHTRPLRLRLGRPPLYNWMGVHAWAGGYLVVFQEASQRRPL